MVALELVHAEVEVKVVVKRKAAARDISPLWLAQELLQQAERAAARYLSALRLKRPPAARDISA